MVQRVERFQTERDIRPFSELERLRDRRVDIPVAGASKCIPAHAELSGCRKCESRSILEEDRSDDSRLVLQFGIRLCAPDEGRTGIAIGGGAASEECRSRAA